MAPDDYGVVRQPRLHRTVLITKEERCQLLPPVLLSSPDILLPDLFPEEHLHQTAPSSHRYLPRLPIEREIRPLPHRRYQLIPVDRAFLRVLPMANHHHLNPVLARR